MVYYATGYRGLEKETLDLTFSPGSRFGCASDMFLGRFPRDSGACAHSRNPSAAEYGDISRGGRLKKQCDFACVRSDRMPS